jgi:hypothetical protein
MILFHQVFESTTTNPMFNEWFLDTASLALARVTITADYTQRKFPCNSALGAQPSACRFNVEIDTVMPDDFAPASGMSGPMEPFSPSTMAARIMAELTERIDPDLRLARVGMISREDSTPPEYLDFYELDRDGVYIMRTCAPAFVAKYVGNYAIEVLAWRGGDDLPAMGWFYYTDEAYDELVTLNSRRAESQPAVR